MKSMASYPIYNPLWTPAQNLLKTTMNCYFWTMIEADHIVYALSTSSAIVHWCLGARMELLIPCDKLLTSACSPGKLLDLWVSKKQMIERLGGSAVEMSEVAVWSLGHGSLVKIITMLATIKTLAGKELKTSCHFLVSSQSMSIYHPSMSTHRFTSCFLTRFVFGWLLLQDILLTVKDRNLYWKRKKVMKKNI